jgi:arylsulfatase A-like enzyme
VLGKKPAHWLAWYDGNWDNQEGFGRFWPASLTHDQLREINAKTHVMNELVDDSCGRILSKVADRGWDADTDVFFTTDHGELQGDFGLLFKGPFHVDALMRLPFVWRPAPSAGVAPAEISEPVGQLDLAPTFCEIAGIAPAHWMQGAPLPIAAGSGRERVLCEWDSQFPGYGMHLRTIYRDGFLCTRYEESTDGQPNGLERAFGERVLKRCGIHYDGSEGELYDVEADPNQWVNLWDDPARRSLRDDLVADLYDHLPPPRRDPLLVETPA